MFVLQSQAYRNLKTVNISQEQEIIVKKGIVLLWESTENNGISAQINLYSHERNRLFSLLLSFPPFPSSLYFFLSILIQSHLLLYFLNSMESEIKY